MVASANAVGMSGGFGCAGNCTYNLSSSVIIGGGPGMKGFLWNTFYQGNGVWPRTQPPSPYYGADADAVVGGQVILDGVSFEGFGGADAAAIANGDAGRFATFPDAYPPMVVRRLTFAPGDRRVWMGDADPGWRTDNDCGDGADCTGYLNTRLLVDTDGSLTGVSGAQLLPRNLPLLSAHPLCRLREEWNAFLCAGTRFRLLYFESADPDKLTRRLWPVRVAGRHGTTALAGFEDHLWNGGWTSMLRLNRYVAPIEEEANVTFTGSLPRKLVLQMPHAHAPEAAKIFVSYVRPEVPVLETSGRQCKRLYEGPPSADDEHCTYYWHNPTRTLRLVFKPGGDPVVSRLTDLVMISMYVSITDAEFWNAATEAFLHNVAYSLGISYTQLVVVGAPRTPTGTSRRLLGGGAGVLDVAWLSPGASNETLHSNMDAALAELRAGAACAAGRRRRRRRGRRAPRIRSAAASRRRR